MNTNDHTHPLSNASKTAMAPGSTEITIEQWPRSFPWATTSSESSGGHIPPTMIPSINVKTADSSHGSSWESSLSAILSQLHRLRAEARESDSIALQDINKASLELVPVFKGLEAERDTALSQMKHLEQMNTALLEKIRGLNVECQELQAAQEVMQWELDASTNQPGGNSTHPIELSNPVSISGSLPQNDSLSRGSGQSLASEQTMQSSSMHSLQAIMAERDAELSTRNKHLETLEATLAQRDTELATLQSEKDALNTAGQERDTALSNLGITNHNLRSELNETKRAHQELEGKLITRDTEIEHLNSQLANAQSTMDQQKRDWDTVAEYLLQQPRDGPILHCFTDKQGKHGSKVFLQYVQNGTEVHFFILHEDHSHEIRQIPVSEYRIKEREYFLFLQLGDSDPRLLWPDDDAEAWIDANVDPKTIDDGTASQSA